MIAEGVVQFYLKIYLKQHLAIYPRDSGWKVFRFVDKMPHILFIFNEDSNVLIHHDAVYQIFLLLKANTCTTIVCLLEIFCIYSDLFRLSYAIIRECAWVYLKRD